jgi:hypothetical protein
MSRKNINFIDLDMEYRVKLNVINGIPNTVLFQAFIAKSLIVRPQTPAIAAGIICRLRSLDSIVRQR